MAEADKVKTCLEFLKHMGEVHWHAEFYHNFFQIALSSNLRVSQARTRADDMRQEAGSPEAFNTRFTDLASSEALEGMDPELSNLSSLPGYLATDMYRQSPAPFWDTLNASGVIEYDRHEWIE